MKIAIIGYGHVGKQIAELFKKEKIIIYDPFINESNGTKETVNKCDLAFICVPTNELAVNGACDTSIVESVVEWVNIPMMIKSTVPPGTCDALVAKYNKTIVFSPEYVGESSYNTSYWTKMLEAPFNIFAGEKDNIKPFLDLFLKYCGPEKKYIQCTFKEAELTKYFENTFFAVKVTLVNEFFDICQALNIDWETVRELWLLDPRINKMHTAVFRDDRGYGGKCYPKDVSALIEFSKASGYSPELIEKAQEVNNKLRNYDIDSNN